MFDESSQCTIVLPDECLGYGLVVPFPAYGFAALVSHNENLNSPKQGRLNSKEYIRDANALLLLCTTHKTCVDPTIEHTQHRRRAMTGVASQAHREAAQNLRGAFAQNTLIQGPAVAR